VVKSRQFTKLIDETFDKAGLSLVPFVHIGNLLENFCLNKLGENIASFIRDYLMFMKMVTDILLNFLLFLPVSFYVVLLFSKDILLNTLKNILKEEVFFCF